MLCITGRTCYQLHDDDADVEQPYFNQSEEPVRETYEMNSEGGKKRSRRASKNPHQDDSKGKSRRSSHSGRKSNASEMPGVPTMGFSTQHNVQAQANKYGAPQQQYSVPQQQQYLPPDANKYQAPQGNKYAY